MSQSIKKKSKSDPQQNYKPAAPIAKVNKSISGRPEVEEVFPI